jgi:hypothetical protein
LLVSLTVKAQFTSEGADLISRFRPGVMWFNTGLRPAEIEKVRKYDRLVFDITYSDWAGESKPFQNKWASLGLNSSLYFDIPMVKNNLVSFGTGLSHSLFTIHHDNQFVPYTMSWTLCYSIKTNWLETVFLFLSNLDFVQKVGNTLNFTLEEKLVIN